MDNSVNLNECFFCERETFDTASESTETSTEEEQKGPVGQTEEETDGEDA